MCGINVSRCENEPRMSVSLLAILFLHYCTFSEMKTIACYFLGIILILAFIFPFGSSVLVTLLTPYLTDHTAVSILDGL